MRIEIPVLSYEEHLTKGNIQEMQFEGAEIDFEQIDCVICYSELESEISRLYCRHLFHKDCLKSWVDTKRPKAQHCMICNREIGERPQPPPEAAANIIELAEGPAQEAEEGFEELEQSEEEIKEEYGDASTVGLKEEEF